MNIDEFKKEMTKPSNKLSEKEETAMVTGLIAYNGIDKQIIIVIEELSELQKQLTKHLRGEGDSDHLLEEIADVSICLSMLFSIFDIDIECWKRAKAIKLLKAYKNVLNGRENKYEHAV